MNKRLILPACVVILGITLNLVAFAGNNKSTDEATTIVSQETDPAHCDTEKRSSCCSAASADKAKDDCADKAATCAPAKSTKEI